MSVPSNNHGAPNGGAPVTYSQPHHPHKGDKRGILVRSFVVITIISAVAFGTVKMLSDMDPWRALLGGPAATDLKTDGQPSPTTPPVAGQAPDTGSAGSKDAGPTGGQAPTPSKPADAGQSGTATPAPGSKPTTPSATTPVVVGIKTLVNRTNPLPSTYVPELVEVKARVTNRITPDERKMQPEAARALEGMLQQAERENIILYCVSGYRSYTTQKWLYEYRVQVEGQTMADLYTARPGQSEHQTGLAMDLANSPLGELSDAFGETVEGKWLVQNAHHHGFIIRYPLGKEATTGYNYEPWHLRYVGVETAKAVVSQGMVLEEYLN